MSKNNKDRMKNFTVFLFYFDVNVKKGIDNSKKILYNIYVCF